MSIEKTTVYYPIHIANHRVTDHRELNAPETYVGLKNAGLQNPSTEVLFLSMSSPWSELTLEKVRDKQLGLLLYLNAHEFFTATIADCGMRFTPSYIEILGQQKGLRIWGNEDHDAYWYRLCDFEAYTAENAIIDDYFEAANQINGSLSHMLEQTNGRPYLIRIPSMA